MAGLPVFVLNPDSKYSSQETCHFAGIRFVHFFFLTIFMDIFLFCVIIFLEILESFIYPEFIHYGILHPLFYNIFCIKFDQRSCFIICSVYIHV